MLFITSFLLAFSESISLGLSTSLAIFFHEIPHELGEYGVLISAGFSHCTVLLLNSFTSFFSFISFLIIVNIKSIDEKVREYIFAITSGVFIYIALANMVIFLIYIGLKNFYILMATLLLRFQESNQYLKLGQTKIEKD
jgi:zinc transporter ZupT